MSKPNQQELPGIPARTPQGKKFLALHEAIMNVCELMAGFDIPAGAQVKIDRELNGDKITVVFKAQDTRI